MGTVEVALEENIKLKTCFKFSKPHELHLALPSDQIEVNISSTLDYNGTFCYAVYAYKLISYRLGTLRLTISIKFYSTAWVTSAKSNIFGKLRTADICYMDLAL